MGDMSPVWKCIQKSLIILWNSKHTYFRARHRYKFSVRLKLSQLNHTNKTGDKDMAAKSNKSRCVRRADNFQEINRTTSDEMELRCKENELIKQFIECHVAPVFFFT